LFLFSKFARYSPRENDNIQISYALLYSPDIFINTTMLTASLTAGKSSLAVKLKEKNGIRQSRACTKNHVNYSDNVTNIPDRQEKLPVKPSKKKGSGKKGKNSVSPSKQSVPCENYAAGLGNTVSHIADEEARGSNVFHGRYFIQSYWIHQSCEKGNVNVEDNENDEDSSFSDPELCPIEDIDEDEFASPQEFFPLASQCSPSFAILSRPPVQYGKG